MPYYTKKIALELYIPVAVEAEDEYKKTSIKVHKGGYR